MYIGTDRSTEQRIQTSLPTHTQIMFGQVRQQFQGGTEPLGKEGVMNVEEEPGLKLHVLCRNYFKMDQCEIKL